MPGGLDMGPLRSISSAGEDDDTGVGTAPHGVGERHARTLDLIVSGVAPQLVDEGDHLSERRGAERLALGQQALHWC